MVLYSASCDWLLLWAIRTQAVRMLLKVEVRIVLKVRTVLPDLYICISCTSFVSPFPILMFWWNTYAESSGGSALSVQNNEIHLDLVQKTKKLNRLQEKVTVLLRYSYFNHFYNCWIICICFQLMYICWIFLSQLELSWFLWMYNKEEFINNCKGGSTNFLRNNLNFHFVGMG